MWIGFLVLACGQDTPAICDSGEVEVTYADFGESFMRQHCQGCHASTSSSRHGAPESVHFDNVDDIWERRDAILRVTTTDSPTMPPAWDLDAGDVMLVEQWLECGSKRSDKRSLRHFNP